MKAMLLTKPQPVEQKPLRSVANATWEDGRELLQLTTGIPLTTEVETYPLDQANEVLLRLKQGKVQGAAVLTI